MGWMGGLSGWLPVDSQRRHDVASNPALDPAATAARSIGSSRSSLTPHGRSSGKRKRRQIARLTLVLLLRRAFVLRVSWLAVQYNSFSSNL